MPLFWTWTVELSEVCLLLFSDWDMGVVCVHAYVFNTFVNISLSGKICVYRCVCVCVCVAVWLPLPPDCSDQLWHLSVFTISLYSTHLQTHTQRCVNQNYVFRPSSKVTVCVCVCVCHCYSLNNSFFFPFCIASYKNEPFQFTSIAIKM